MKRAAVSGVVCALLLAGFAWATQDWRDNQSGANPTTGVPTFSLWGLKQLAVGTKTPDPGAAITVQDEGGIPAKVTLLNDLGAVPAIQLPGVRYTDTTSASGAGQNNVVVDLPTGGSIGKQGIWAYNDYPVAFVGPYTIDGLLQGDAFGYRIRPSTAGGAGNTGYTWFGAYNSDNLFGAMVMAGAVPAKHPFAAISDALWLWNVNGPVCLGTNGSTSVDATCAFELDGSQNILATSLAGSGTRCIQVGDDGKFAVAAGPCASGSGTIVGPLSHDVTTPSSSSGVASVVGLTDSGATDHQIGLLTAGQCLEIDASTGHVVTVPCSAGGTVTSVTGTAQRVSVVNPTTTPQVDTIGGFYSGAVSGGNEDLGTLSTGLDKLTVTGGVAVMSTAAPGTDYTVSVAGTPPVNVSGSGGVRTVSLVTDSTLDVVIGNLGVDGINDGSGTPWLSSGAWSNGKALGTVAGGIQAVSFQAPLTACTDYVSLACQTTGTDIANTNAQVHVDALHESGGGRRPIGSIAAPGTVLVWDGSFVAGYLPLGDLSNDYTDPWVSAIHETSGPQQLTIVGIPNAAPDVNVLVRDGLNLNEIEGIPSKALLGNAPFDYTATYGGPNFIVDLPPLAFTGANPDFWLRPDSGFNTSIGGPANFATQGQVWDIDTGGNYGSVSLRAFVYQCAITTTGGTNDFTLTVTKNGSNTGVAVVASCPVGGTTNADYSTSGTVSFGPSDRVGIRGTVTNTGAYTSGALRATAHARLSP